ncbi:MAG: putative LytR family regulatory protein [Ilumatobacteraceae bacterium]|nr:putative LytR family regulatory protein [Ilumatobacteraceae bacterium]
MTWPIEADSLPWTVVYTTSGGSTNSWSEPARPQRRPNRLLSVLLIAGAVAAAGTAGTLVAARSAIDTVTRIPDIAQVLSPPSSTVENFLLVGSDSRAGADPDSPDAGGIGTETDVQGSRSDTIMVLRRDKATGTASLLSIPRDLWVNIPGHEKKSRINSAYNDGPAVLIQTVQQALGLPIHHYLEVDFFGFKDIVDSLGGVRMCFDYPAQDTNTGLYIELPGCYVLDGVQALAFARSRHYEEFRDGDWHEDGTADIGRTKRQQLFVNTMLTTALAKVKSNPFIAGDLLTSTGSALHIDDELDILAAASSLRGAVQGGLEPWSLPVHGKTINGNAVLELSDGADALLSYFRGEGPAPVPAA